MAADTRDWTVPAPIRALLWWPPVALVLVVVAPDAATGAIAVVGGMLAVIGTLGPVLARTLRAVFGRAGQPDVAAVVAADTVPVHAGQRAA